MAQDELNSLDFFAGGVPAGTIFQMHMRAIKELLDARPHDQIGHTLEEVCFIGLVSYFEAFCRDCFASLINICPELIEGLRSKNYEVRIDSLAALKLSSNLHCNIGFLVSEQLDFGTSHKINALYAALIGITPFSKGEMKTFDRILADRNLLVHHGGIYTRSYFHQKIGVLLEEARLFMDSLVINYDYVMTILSFLFQIAEKIVNASHVKISNKIASGELSIGIHAQKALKLFNWWDKEL